MSIDRRRFLYIVSTVGGAISCGPRPTTEKWPNHVGEVVRCGWFSFNVLEVAYKSQLGDGTLARRPKAGFLLIRVSVTSGAGQSVSLPFLRLASSDGEEIGEVEDASAQPNWLGVLRRVEPGGTETGWIVFDTAPGVYGLRLTDGVLDDEKTAMVRIPFQVDTTLKT